jgi:predicted dehydrogenase
MAEIRGMQNDEQEFRTLSIPEHILEGVAPTQTVFEQLIEVFTKQSVGDRLFIDAILRDGPVFPTFHEGLKAQEIINAAIASHRSGRWVSLQ